MFELAKKTHNDLNQINQWLLKTSLIESYNIDYTIVKDNFIIEPKFRDVQRSDLDQYELDKEKLSRYEKSYIQMARINDFSFIMFDGAIIQCYFKFKDKNLVRQNMSFYQSPFRKPFDLYPESYFTGSDDHARFLLMSDLGSVIHFRFDYDPVNFKEYFHPRTHLHLGMFENCRIPVLRPLCVLSFFDFIIKNFYSELYAAFNAHLKKFKGLFKERCYPETITPLEKNTLHISNS